MRGSRHELCDPENLKAVLASGQASSLDLLLFDQQHARVSLPQRTIPQRDSVTSRKHSGDGQEVHGRWRKPHLQTIQYG